MTAAQAASTEERFATGDATVQSVVNQLEGRLADSKAKLAQALVSIQTGLTAVETRAATSEGKLADALAQMSAAVSSIAVGVGIPSPNLGRGAQPQNRGGEPTSAKGPLGEGAFAGTGGRPTGHGLRLQRVDGAGGVPLEGVHFGCAV